MKIDWNTLQSKLSGEVLIAGDPGYEVARRPALTRFADARPEAVVFATSAADVVATIQFARKEGLHVSPRSGGHCFAGRSSSGDIVIDLSEISSVAVDDHGLATVDAGVRLGELNEALARHGRALPTGCGRSVGISGLTLGGGLGVLGRKYGLTCDRFRGATVVLADGGIVECDEAQNADLFWALRGGGGNFGIVTSFVFATLPTPSTAPFYFGWPAAQALAVAGAWQEWAPNAPDEISAELRISQQPEAPVALVGLMLGTESDADRLLGDFVARAGVAPATTAIQMMSYAQAKRWLATVGSSAVEETEPRIEFSKSEFFRRPLPQHVLESLLKHLSNSNPSSQVRQLSFMPLGGAYNRIPPDATAFAHRSETFLVQHVVTIETGATITQISDARDWLARSWAMLHPFGSRAVYPNFPDLDLENWQRAYYGDNYERLVRVKEAYDPEGCFRYPQSIGSGS
jgi:FAD/FMN-containing dehydrogenase